MVKILGPTTNRCPEPRSPASFHQISAESGRSRGFGFVEMLDDGQATSAIEMLNEREVDGRALVVNQARPREERSGPSGGDRGRRY